MAREIKRYQQALDIAQEARKAAQSEAERTEARRAEGNLLNRLGLAYADLGQADRAIDHYHQALDAAQEMYETSSSEAVRTEARRAESNLLNNLGNAYAALGQADRAIWHYEQALAISRQLFRAAQSEAERAEARRAESDQLGNLGAVYASIAEGAEEMARAIEHYTQALAISRENGDHRGEGNQLGNLGNAYAALAEGTKGVERAAELYRQALDIHQGTGDRRAQAYLCWNLGLLYEDTDPAKAAELMSALVAYEREIGHPDAEVDAERLAQIRARIET